MSGWLGGAPATPAAIRRSPEEQAQVTAWSGSVTYGSSGNDSTIKYTVRGPSGDGEAS